MMNFSAMVQCKVRYIDAAYCSLLAQVGGLTPEDNLYIARHCLMDANWQAGQARLQALMHSGFKLGPVSLGLIQQCLYQSFALLPRLQDMVKLGFNINDYDTSDSVLHVVARCYAPDAQDCIMYVRNQGARLRRLKGRGWLLS